jgi:hypothetical protein
MASFLGCFDVL